MRHYTREIDVRYYVANNGRAPFIEWLEALKDRDARARIKLRIDRLMRGLFGDTRALGGGIEELRVHAGPGYRVYYGRVEATILLLLCGGSKDRQGRDIDRARAYWRDYLEALHEESEDQEKR